MAHTLLLLHRVGVVPLETEAPQLLEARQHQLVMVMVLVREWMLGVVLMVERVTPEGVHQLGVHLHVLGVIQLALTLMLLEVQVGVAGMERVGMERVPRGGDEEGSLGGGAKTKRTMRVRVNQRRKKRKRRK